jgi:hypothetical protein
VAQTRRVLFAKKLIDETDWAMLDVAVAAGYVAMRTLREPDAFPSGDLGLRKVTADGRDPIPARALATRSEAWRPFRAYAAAHLWERLASGADTAHSSDARRRSSVPA